MYGTSSLPKRSRHLPVSISTLICFSFITSAHTTQNGPSPLVQQSLCDLLHQLNSCVDAVLINPSVTCLCHICFCLHYYIFRFPVYYFHKIKLLLVQAHKY
jgi:hypothetical protein